MIVKLRKIYSGLGPPIINSIYVEFDPKLISLDEVKAVFFQYENTDKDIDFNTFAKSLRRAVREVQIKEYTI